MLSRGLIPFLTVLMALAGADGRAQDAAPKWRVDTERSTLVVKLKKAGLMRFLGHEHGIVPGAWSADVRFDPDDLDASRIVVEVATPELVIDSERARRLAGVDPDGPNEEERTQIHADMLSARYLDAETFPLIRFESTSLRRRGDSTLRIRGSLSVHGETRPVELDAELQPDGEGYVMRGAFAIEQRDFGIEPASIGGVVKVANEVEIRFEIFAGPGVPAAPATAAAGR
ncbi:MAG: YceI family protein [Acidobacteriota bacterium]